MDIFPGNRFCEITISPKTAGQHLSQYQKTHDDSILPDVEEPLGLFYSLHKGFGELYNAAVAKMDEVEAGTTDPKEVSRYIFNLVRNANSTPRRITWAIWNGTYQCWLARPTCAP